MSQWRPGTNDAATVGRYNHHKLPHYRVDSNVRRIAPHRRDGLHLNLDPENFHNLNNTHYYHHHVSVTELDRLLIRSGLMYPEVSSKVCHDFFYCEAFYLHVLSIFSCIPVSCPKLVLFLTPLQFLNNSSLIK